jgi:hypothetical protein
MSLLVFRSTKHGALRTAVFCALIALGINAQAVETLCNPSEIVVFSCPIARSTKIASVCASETLTEQKGYVQYRFGTRKKIELEFPKDRQGSVDQFVLSFYMRPMVTRASISFEIHGNRYAVTSDDESEEGYERHEHGVDVVTATGKHVSLPCGKGVKADFLHVRDAMPCEADESGNCMW